MTVRPEGSVPGDAADVLVLGAGPAGIGAAVAARGQGLSVLVLDEAAEAGGQAHRATVLSPSGAALRARLAASGAQCRLGELAWSVTPRQGGGFRVDTLGEAGPHVLEAAALVVATGAQERVVPFPGWTLPGVTGLAAAAALVRSPGIAPGRSTLVAGTGPLLAAVAVGILEAGGEVAAVVDLCSRRRWLATLPALALRPGLLRRGLGWHARLRAAGVPVLFGHGLERVEPQGDRLAATLRATGASGRRRMVVDAVAVGHGLLPACDVTRLLRAEHAYDERRGHWHPRLDRDFRSSIPGLYVAGDGAGIAGAEAAELQGRIAGLAAARDLGCRVPPRELAALYRGAARAAGAGIALARLGAPDRRQVDAIAPGTIVCRCEDVPRAALDLAIAHGARDANQLKSWTRCGMGSCQGRLCGDVAARLLAAGTGRDRAAIGAFTMRTPLRPLPVAMLTGTYDYADIQLPPAAPL